jgi:hypothetical protein
LVSIGGWNSPHPDPSFTAQEWMTEFDRWNREVVSRPADSWEGFAGFDWDIEGNDDGAHHGNEFSLEVLDLMGEMSVLAKATYGYIVAMAPAQSYLDVHTQSFSRKVNHSPREPWQPDFPYSGRNVYAYILAAYGVGTFDFISVQLYEGWSSANYAVRPAGVGSASASENGSGNGNSNSNGNGNGSGSRTTQYIIMLVTDILQGWEVDFTTDPDTARLGIVRIEISRQQLVLGLANGWASPIEAGRSSLSF